MAKSRFLRTLLLAAVIVGGIWALVHRDQIGRPEDAFALLKSQVGGLLPARNRSVNSPPNFGSPNLRQTTGVAPSQYPSYPNGSTRLPTYSQSVAKPTVAPFGTQLVANQRTDGVIRLAVFKLNEKAPYLKSNEPVRSVGSMMLWLYKT